MNKINLTNLLMMTKNQYKNWFAINRIPKEERTEILIEKVSYYEIFLHSINLKQEFLDWHKAQQVVIAKEKENHEARLERLARELGL